MWHKLLILFIALSVTVGAAYYVGTMSKGKSVLAEKTGPLSASGSAKPVASSSAQVSPVKRYCTKLGGKIVVTRQINGTLHAVCAIGEIRCEEWSLFRGDCGHRLRLLKTASGSATASGSGLTNPTLANPASVHCANVGGTTQIMTKPNGGQYGLCMFPDNNACEEWALFRGDCKKPGVRTTGYDNDAQKYCAWVGGQTLAVEHATCTFKDGSVCSDEALYNGDCQKGQY